MENVLSCKLANCVMKKNFDKKSAKTQYSAVPVQMETGDYNWLLEEFDRPNKMPHSIPCIASGEEKES